MARINFDIAKRLDIACRRGDSFSLELTLKDSSGIPINLHGGTEAKFHMLARDNAGTGQIRIHTTGSSFSPGSASRAITPSVTDDTNSTTADTSDASYDASTAASGVVKFELSAEDMKFANLDPGDKYWLYDIQYEDVTSANQVDSLNNIRTILHGSLFIKDDISIRTAVT